jgi:hypothetical protein
LALRGWSWDAVAGPAGAGRRPLLEALEAALPDAAVEDAIDRTGARERRPVPPGGRPFRVLPFRVLRVPGRASSYTEAKVRLA